MTTEDWPTDGTCRRCGAAPRRLYGLCAACMGEAAHRLASQRDPHAVESDLLARADAINKLLADDPFCQGCVAKDTVEAIAALSTLPDAVAGERERCAKIADAVITRCLQTVNGHGSNAAKRIRDAIRKGVP